MARFREPVKTYDEDCCCICILGYGAQQGYSSYGDHAGQSYSQQSGKAILHIKTGQVHLNIDVTMFMDAVLDDIILCLSSL